MALFSACSGKNKTEAAEFFERGNYHFKKHEYERAIELFSEAIEKVPDFADAYNNRGLCYESSGNLERAIGDYRKAVSLDDSFDQAKLNLAAALNHAQQLDESGKLFAELQAVYADSAQFLNYRGQYFLNRFDSDRALIDFEKLIKNFGPNPENLTNLGYAYYQKRDYAQAKTQFERALAIDPDFAFALNNLAATLAQTNDWAQALSYSSRLVKNHSTELNFLNTHALNLLENQQLNEAAEFIHKALKIDPANPYSLRNKAVLALKSENGAEAREILEKVEAQNPEVEFLYYYLGRSVESKTKACAHYQRGAKLHDSRCEMALSDC